METSIKECAGKPTRGRGPRVSLSTPMIKARSAIRMRRVRENLFHYGEMY